MESAAKKSKGVLIDSNVWIGARNTADTLNKEATEALKDASEKEIKIFCTNFIIQEVCTVLILAGRRKEAIQFFAFVTENEQVQIINLDEYWLGETIKLMEEGALTKKMSLVDYTNIYVSLAFGFQLLTFDKQLRTTFTQAQKAFS